MISCFFASGIALAAGSTFAQTPIVSLALSAQKQGNALASALLREDYAAVAATTCSPILGRVGGAVALAQQIEVSFKVMQHQGRQLLRMRFGLPTTVLDGGETHFALVPYHSVVSVRNGRLTVHSHYLAVRNKDADAWCFIDTAALTADSLHDFYPGAPQQLRLPAPAQPIFKAVAADAQ
jgi:hypothetical protein